MTPEEQIEEVRRLENLIGVECYAQMLVRPMVKSRMYDLGKQIVAVTRTQVVSYDRFIPRLRLDY